MKYTGLKYAVLGSGSSANSYIFQFNGRTFFVDNGFSCKKAMERAVSLGIEPGQTFSKGGFSFSAFSTFHDAEYSISYHFSIGPVTFTLITDTGFLSRQMYDLACVSDVLFLEANYDETMLREGLYHPDLKKRILSSTGHLSNRDALFFLNQVDENPVSRLKEVYFCHLSSNNNSPEVLEEEINTHLTWPGKWVICPKGEMVNQLAD